MCSWDSWEHFQLFKWHNTLFKDGRLASDLVVKCCAWCLILQMFQDCFLVAFCACSRGNVCASSVTDLSLAFTGINIDKSIKITGSKTQIVVCLRITGQLCRSLLPYRCQNLQMSCTSVRTNSGHKKRRVSP